MKSTWNLIGVFLWLILIVFLIFIIRDIRKRNLRQIVVEKKNFSWQNFLINAAEVLIFLVGLWFMSYQTFFKPVALHDPKEVQLSYSFKPLVIQTDKNHSYYAYVYSRGKEKKSQSITYWVNGAQYTVSSRDASLVDGSTAIDVQSSAFPWPKKRVDKIDKLSEHAFVGTLTATYQKTWENGIGLHAGRKAKEYRLIRIPDDSFAKTSSKQLQ